MLKAFVFVVGVAASLFVGAPLAIIGLLALSGSLAMDPTDGIWYGLVHLGLAMPIIAGTLLAYCWLAENVYFRFGLGSFMLLLTFICFVLGGSAVLRFNF